MAGYSWDHIPVIPRWNIAAVDSDETQCCSQHRQPDDQYEPKLASIAPGHGDRLCRRSDRGRILYLRVHRRIINL